LSDLYIFLTENGVSGQTKAAGVFQYRNISGRSIKSRQIINWVRFTQSANGAIAEVDKFPICEYKSKWMLIIRAFSISGLKHFQLEMEGAERDWHDDSRIRRVRSQWLESQAARGLTRHRPRLM
jgi:hypothetical protein